LIATEPQARGVGNPPTPGAMAKRSAATPSAEPQPEPGSLRIRVQTDEGGVRIVAVARETP